MSQKQTPADEVVLEEDRPPPPVAYNDTKPLLSETHSASEGSTWASWLSSQKEAARLAKESLPTGSPVQPSPKRTPRSARAPASPPISPGTRSGAAASRERIEFLRSQKQSEAQELEDLKELLSRTGYTANRGVGYRVGDVATQGLRKLDDGQNDSIATLHRRRVAEDEMAEDIAAAAGRPAWNGSAMRDTPTALRGVKPVTDEPWARDAAIYEDRLSRGRTSDGKKAHFSTIENGMQAFRKDLGAGKNIPSSARAHGSQGQSSRGSPTTPHTGRGGTARVTARTSARARSARGGNYKRPEPQLSPKSEARLAKVRARLESAGVSKL